MGAISIFGPVAHLSFVPTWNAGTFANAVEENVIQNAAEMFGGNWCLQLDNATPHRAAQAQQQLLNNEVPAIQPASLSDLNPIENAWVLLKRKMALRNCQTAAQLRAALEQEWVALKLHEIIPFAASMSNQLTDDVITGYGHHKASRPHLNALFTEP
ncbi:MAG: transposase [Bacteroidota bacterium]